MSDRPLTPGEITLCLPIFNQAIDYTRVKVHNGQYWLFLGLQNPDMAVTPNGEMFFPPTMYHDDFSLADSSYQSLFVHEMVHVWQYQLGYGLKTRKLQFWKPKLTYIYTLDSANTLAHYNMEAQGNLLADYFALTVLGSPEIVHEQRHVDDLSLYKQVLQLFLANPADKACLPLPHL